MVFYFQIFVKKTTLNSNSYSWNIEGIPARNVSLQSAEVSASKPNVHSQESLCVWITQHGHGPLTPQDSFYTFGFYSHISQGSSPGAGNVGTPHGRGRAGLGPAVPAQSSWGHWGGAAWALGTSLACACLDLGSEPLGGHSSVAPLAGKGRAVGRWRLVLLLGCWSRAGGPRGLTWGPQLSAGGQRGLGRGRQGWGCHTVGLGDSTCVEDCVMC